MKKTFAAALAACVLLTACGPASSAPAPADTLFDTEPVRAGAAFEFARDEDAVFVMEYEPVPDAATHQVFGLDMPENTDTDWLGDSVFDSSYSIYENDTGKAYGSVKITTAPADPAAYYGTDDPKRIRELMLSTFFVTDDVYAGLKKAIVEDFEYDLAVDWTGTAYDWPAFYLEFIDADSQTRSLRFYACNGEFDENFYAITINANLSMDDAQELAKLRKLIFSLHPRGE